MPAKVSPARVLLVRPAIALFFIVVLLLQMWAVRTWLGVGWGQSPVPVGPTEVAYGCSWNPLDYMCYLSFAEQAREGRLLFENLFCTDPQSPQLFNAFFLLVGGLAAALHVPAAFIYILLGFVGAGFAVWFTFRCAWELRIGFAGQICLGLLLLMGSGLSWMRPLIQQFSGREWPVGTDVAFLDLFPATAFHIYPLHSCALAVTAWMLSGLLRVERIVSEGGAVSGRALFHIALPAFLLAGMRPYEPVALGLVACAHLAFVRFTHGRPAFWVRLPITVTLLLAFAPGFCYAFWVSRQPAWNTFSSEAVALYQQKRQILIGLGALFAGALVGLAGVRRQINTAWRFLGIWAVLVMVLTLGVNSGKIKLASSSFLALALLCASAFQAGWVGWAASLPRRIHLGFIRVGLALVLAALLVNAPMFLSQLKISRPHCDAELLAMAEKIRALHPSPGPNILAEYEASAPLSGLFGFHTYLGHFLITPHFKEHEQAVLEAGLSPSPGSEGTTAETLEELLAASRADFVLVRNELPAAKVLAKLRDVVLVARMDRWSCFQAQHR